MTALEDAAPLGEGGAREQGRNASGGGARTKPSRPDLHAGLSGAGRDRPPPPLGGAGPLWPVPGGSGAA